jgi:hypothetical protein
VLVSSASSQLHARSHRSAVSRLRRQAGTSWQIGDKAKDVKFVCGSNTSSCCGQVGGFTFLSSPALIEQYFDRRPYCRHL